VNVVHKMTLLIIVLDYINSLPKGSEENEGQNGQVLQTRPQKGLWLVSIVTCGFRDGFPDSGNQVRLDSLDLSLTEVTVTVVKEVTKDRGLIEV
jgi:hypothetical protein